MQPPLDPAPLQSWRDLLSDAERAAFMPDLIDTFLAESATQLAALHTTMLAGDLVACRVLAHRLQGCCGMIGARYLRHLCAELEALAAVDPPPPLGEHLSQIEAEYGRVTQALERERY